MATTNMEQQQQKSAPPYYQVNYVVENVGRVRTGSKKRVTWTFMENNINTSNTHTVMLLWSKSSGKHRIEMDGALIQIALTSEPKPRASEIAFSWSHQGKHFQVAARKKTPTNNVDPSFRKFDLYIDNFCFATLPRQQGQQQGVGTPVVRADVPVVPVQEPLGLVAPEQQARDFDQGGGQQGSLQPISIPSVDFPKFKGKVIFRPPEGQTNETYTAHAYQYATTGFQSGGLFSPAAIIFAEKDKDHSDICTAIAHAKRNHLSIAIRSGGHQYLGFSSTGGDNLQLDVSAYTDMEYDAEDSTLTLDVGLRLNEVSEYCAEKEIFFPHGECSHVAVGGHLHTGGYSVFTRSFGMFIDWVEWFEIITADGAIRRIHRPRNHNNRDNDDLWFSVLGGSPGNFGVVVRLKVRCAHDRDYAQARGLFQYYPFTKNSLKDMLELLEEINDNSDLNSNYCFSVMVLSKGSLHRYELDESMARSHPHIFGEGFLKLLVQGHLPASAMVMAVWTGVEEEDPKEAEQWMEAIEAKMNTHKPTDILQKVQYALINQIMGVRKIHQPMRISTLTKKCVWRFVREFNMPFQKRVWLGTTPNLKERGFSSWATEKCWELESKTDTNGCKLGAQWIAGGAIDKVDSSPNPVALGYRRTERYMSTCGMDVFYETKTDKGQDWAEPFETAKDWLDRGDESVSNVAIGQKVFADEDRRCLYAPWCGENTTSDPWSNNVILDDDWKYYYDNKAVYDRVLKTKLEVDPFHIFSPNCFCVGYRDKMERNKAKQDHTMNRQSRDQRLFRIKPEQDVLSIIRDIEAQQEVEPVQ